MLQLKQLYDIQSREWFVLKEFSEGSFEKVLTVLQSANLRGRAAANVKRGEWNRNSISRPSLIPVRCARISPVKPSHDYANSAIIYFSFALPFPSYPPRKRATLLSLNPLLRWWAVTRIEQLWSAQGFWCSHQLFLRPVRHAKQWITH